MTLRIIKHTLKIFWDCSKIPFLIFVLCQTFIALSSLVETVTLKGVIDTVNGNKSIFGLSLLGIITARLVYEVVKKFIEGVSRWVDATMTSDMTLHMNKILVDKVATLDLGVLENSETAGLMQRAFNRMSIHREYLANIVGLAGSLISALVSTTVFIFASPLFALALVASYTVSLFARSKLSGEAFYIYRADDETRRKFGYALNILTDKNTLPEIKMYRAFEFFKNKLVSIYQIFATNQLRITKKQQLVKTVADLLPVVALYFFSVSLIRELLGNQMTTGTFVFVFTNMLIFSGTLQNIGRYMIALNDDTFFVKDTMEFLQVKPSINFKPTDFDRGTKIAEKLAKPSLRLEGVYFKYPSTDIYALENVNLDIPYGQNIAIVGENGAGKTTLIKLLLRLYDPTKGLITINGVDIRELPENLLFSVYSTLFQNSGKFYLSIKENLEMAAGRKLADEEAEKFLKFSNAFEFVKGLKGGLYQQLGTEYWSGTELSGGQWQRLAIARAYAKGAPILILDEPTSAIDAKAEMEIFERLTKEMKENTLLFISHRFSTIKDAEKIVVLDKGKIVEYGNHHELMQNNRKYSDLYTMQAERYLREDNGVSTII